MLTSFPLHKVLFKLQFTVLVWRCKLPRHLSKAFKMVALRTIIPCSISFETFWKLHMFRLIGVRLLHDVQPTPVVVFACQIWVKWLNQSSILSAQQLLASRFVNSKVFTCVIVKPWMKKLVGKSKLTIQLLNYFYSWYLAIVLTGLFQLSLYDRYKYKLKF